MSTENQQLAEEVADAEAFASAFIDALAVDEGDSAKKEEPAKVEPAVKAEAAPAKEEAAPAKEEAEPTKVEAEPTKVEAEPAKVEPAKAEPKPEPVVRREREPEPAPAPAPEKKEEKPFFTAEEQGIIDEFVKDWPEAARAQELIRRREYHQVVTHVFDEVAKALAPIMSYVESLQGTEHEKTIYQAHPDFDEHVGACEKWVDTQPKYLRDTYKRVMLEGTADEVNDLMTRFKEANSITSSKGGGPQKTEVVVDTAGSTTASPKAKEAAQRLSVVGTKRSTVGSGAADPNDFDAGFREALGS